MITPKEINAYKPGPKLYVCHSLAVALSALCFSSRAEHGHCSFYGCQRSYGRAIAQDWNRLQTKARWLSISCRYQSDWIPSWKNHPDKPRGYFEDSHAASYNTVIDATRSDGKLVALKKLRVPDAENEIAVGTLLSTEPFVSYLDNHCVPILEVLQVPDDPTTTLVVMPYLHEFDAPRFETVGEVIELLSQVFRCLKMMHDNHIAHRDIKSNNIMADTLHLYNPLPHPTIASKSRDFRRAPRVVSSRTRRPVRYYLIDFGLSKVYRPEDAPFQESPGWGGDKTVPEFQKKEQELCDPFPVDVYCMGNFVREYFLTGDEHEPPKKGLEFMRDLVQDMVNDDPKQRPTMAEVVSRFEEITNDLSHWKLRSRVANAGEPMIPRWFRFVRHWIKQATYVVRRIPAIPKPPSSSSPVNGTSTSNLNPLTIRSLRRRFFPTRKA